jgi:prepilin-type N-terminal cleavage/methylation domain-containing protein
MSGIYKKNKRGFTMVELLIVVSIMSLIVAAVVVPLRSNIGVWESGDRYAEVMQNALIGMDKMTRELKYATQIIAFGSWEILPSTDPPRFEGFVEFTDRLGTTQMFRYNATTLHDMASSITDGDENLMYGSPDSLSILTGPISSLKFSCFQSDGSVPTNAPEKIAVIQIDMTTDDSQGKVPNIPLTTKVRVRMDQGDNIMDITDYCMFGKSGVTIKNKATITSSDPVNMPANIGSLTNLIAEDNLVEVYGNIVTGGDLIMKNNSLVAYDVFVNNTVNVSNGASVSGNVNCNGTVIANGTISGYVNLSPEGTISGTGYDPGKLIDEGGISPLKFYNPLPPATTFNVGADPITVINNGNKDLLPGKYGNIVLNNNSSLNLTAGKYYFNSLSAENPGCTININFTSSTDTIQIFIANNVNGANGAVVKVNGGGDDRYSRVYTEVQGNFSWNGCWQGTLFVPNGNTSFTNNTSYSLNGAIYSGGTLIVDHPLMDIVYTPAIPPILPWINP